MIAPKSIVEKGIVLLLAGMFHGCCTFKRAPTESAVDTGDSTRFLSLSYNHFAGGILFENIEQGLDVLWGASFKNDRPYRENLAFFVSGGLLILPNGQNTCYSARITALPMVNRDEIPFAFYDGKWKEVLAIIHTHPDLHSMPLPTPTRDYQYCYAGLHNYVMDHRNLFDAFKDTQGNECYRRLGNRKSYDRIPFVSGIAVANR